MTQEVIFAVAGVMAALGVIVGGLISIYKLIRRVDDAIGTDKSGRTLSERMDRVEHQLWENGGSSLADKVNDLHTSSKVTETEIVFIKDTLLVLLGNVQPLPQKTTTRRSKVAQKSGDSFSK